MRRAAKVDANHTAIVNALRAIGCCVLDLAGVGKGCPDLLVWSSRLTRYVLLEVKDGTKSPSRRKLTDAQVKFHGAWRGPVVVVESVDEALALFGAAIPAYITRVDP